MIACHEAEALIGDRLDGAITAADDRVLDAHVASCPACAAHLAAAATIDRQLGARLGGIEAPPSLASAVRRRIEREPMPVPSRAAWLVDVLNASGLVVVGIAALAIGPVLSVTGLLFAAVAVAAACYPLVLGGLAGDAGPGDPGTAQPARQR